MSLNDYNTNRQALHCLVKLFYDEHFCLFDILENIIQQRAIKIIYTQNLKSQHLFLDFKLQLLSNIFLYYVLTKYLIQIDK